MPETHLPFVRDDEEFDLCIRFSRQGEICAVSRVEIWNPVTREWERFEMTNEELLDLDRRLTEEWYEDD